MNKLLDVKISEVLQGDFAFEALNLLLVFQVNCPGCFTYALPLANQITQQYGDKVLKVLGLSTAFEDFDLNTLDNTRKLIKRGSLVGETKKTLSRGGYDKLPYDILFPVAFDSLSANENLNQQKEIEKVCAAIPDFGELSDGKKEMVRRQVREYLAHKQFVAHTFDANNLRGTPSWVLFDKDLNILWEDFGHVSKEALVKILERHESV